jgi:hypothetical protein
MTPYAPSFSQMWLSSADSAYSYWPGRVALIISVCAIAPIRPARRSTAISAGDVIVRSSYHV